MRKPFRVLSSILISVLAVGAVSAGSAVTVMASSPPFTLDFTTVASGLDQPIFVTNAGDGSNRLFIVQQGGKILILPNGSSSPNATPFLDVSSVSDFTSDENGGDSEQGLLGLAFDPNYSTNGYFYVAYTTNTGGIACPFVPTSSQTCPYTTTLARYQVSGDPDVADPTSATVLLSVPKIYTNHNGGMLAFGPDGDLYASIGDGGSGGDPDGNGQSLDTLSAKLLRLDVHSTPDPGKNYAIPHSNPFYGTADSNVQQEIWAYGLRNSWRFSFDKSTGDLYIGDVGQDRQEEVDFQPASSLGGANYGWNCREGNLTYNSASCTGITHYVAPVTVYNHGTADSYGCAVIGGYVYRGTQSVVMRGYYIYGDLCSGKVFGLIKNASNVWTSTVLASTGYQISSFGQDEQGELYLTDLGGGQVVKISHPLTTVTNTFRSIGSQDGYVTESAQGSGLGGPINAGAGIFRLGDSLTNQQYRAVVSFNTAPLPDAAVITSATLGIRQASITAASPFGSLGNLVVDMAIPNFGSGPTLLAEDFQAAPTQTDVATINPVPVSWWYTASLPGAALSAINLSGYTQFRLEFEQPTNSDAVANYVNLYSGNIRTAASRPLLTIQYNIP